MRQRQPLRLDAQAEEAGVAVERLAQGSEGELGELPGVEDGVEKQPGPQALADELDGAAERHDRDDLDWLGEQWPGDDCAGAEAIVRRGEAPRCRSELTTCPEQHKDAWRLPPSQLPVER